MSVVKALGLALVASVASLGVAPAALADPINYIFTNASYANASDSATLTGSFVWNTDTNSITSSDITSPAWTTAMP